MSVPTIIPAHSLSKEEKYKEILLQVPALISGESNTIANLSNITALLNQYFHWWWVGFYLVERDELVLGPFQGPVACTRIQKGKGVCGSSWERKESIIVDDVNTFPGHIACSAASQSEIVIPLIGDNRVLGVLDVDSEYLQHFDGTDRIYLEKLAEICVSVIEPQASL